jgi:hypothetical protein
MYQNFPKSNTNFMPSFNRKWKMSNHIITEDFYLLFYFVILCWRPIIFCSVKWISVLHGCPVLELF